MLSTVPIFAPVFPKESSKSLRTPRKNFRLFSSTRNASRVIIEIVSSVFATDYSPRDLPATGPVFLVAQPFVVSIRQLIHRYRRFGGRPAHGRNRRRG